MLSGAVAEEEGESLRFVALGQVDIEFGGGGQNALPNGWIDTRAPIQHARDGRDADLCRRGDLPKAQLALSRRIFGHAYREPGPCRSVRLCESASTIQKIFPASNEQEVN